jgi:hypothetical protein
MSLKDYKPVKPRIQEMRTEHPDWTIKTRVEHRDGFWHSRTKILDGHRLIATGHAVEKAEQAFDMEKAETSSVGRALVFAGYPDDLRISPEEEARAQVVNYQKETPQKATSHASPPTSTAPVYTVEYLVEYPPVQAAPKPVWQAHIAALVEATKAESLDFDWKLFAGKPFDKLTSDELKDLTARAGRILAPSDLIDVERA